MDDIIDFLIKYLFGFCSGILVWILGANFYANYKKRKREEKENAAYFEFNDKEDKNIDEMYD